MEHPFRFHVRVNGIPVKEVRLRGAQGARQLVILDPTLGAFKVDDRFWIEVRESDPAASVELTNNDWRRVSTQALIEMLSPDANNNEHENGDSCSWLHDSDLAELGTPRPMPRPTPPSVRLTFNKAARALYNAGVPYFLLGMFRPPNDDPGSCTHAVLLLVPDAKQAHACLCAKGFEPHPTWCRSVIHRKYSFEVRLIPDRLPR